VIFSFLAVLRVASFLAPLLTTQGQAIRLSLPDEPGIESVEIKFQDKTIPYIHAGKVWTTVLGIDLDVKPGSHSGEIRIKKDGKTEKRTQTFTVTAGKFSIQRLKVADQYVELSKENTERALKEQKDLDEIHNTITPEAFWTEPFIVPVPGGVGANFGSRRVFNGESRNPHGGADLRATTGTPVRSTNRGRVVLAGDLFFTGNTVIVDHGLGIYTLYAHLSRIDVKKDAMVERAQVIGLAGATGRVTGPHLHWGARVQNARVDPFSLINLR
jgi:murein DD-endopeptidase MepM/ murein hydrolase activator NlpD